MIQCRIKKFYDSDDDDCYPHQVIQLKREGALILQNFLNTIAVSDQPLNAIDDYWDSDSGLWISEGEYQALLDNAELLGIEFIVEGGGV